MKKVLFLLASLILLSCEHQEVFRTSDGRIIVMTSNKDSKVVVSLDERIVIVTDVAFVSGIDNFEKGDTVVLEIRSVPGDPFYSHEKWKYDYKILKDSNYTNLYDEPIIQVYGNGTEYRTTESFTYHRSVIR